MRLRVDARFFEAMLSGFETQLDELEQELLVLADDEKRYGRASNVLAFPRRRSASSPRSRRTP